MSLSGVVKSIWKLTATERAVIAGALTAAIAGGSALGDSALTIGVRATLWFAAAALLERTLETLRGATIDRKALAYLPLPCAAVAWWLAKITAPHVTRSGSLGMFFATAASLLGLLLVSLVVEARRVTTGDKWLLALRGWWVGFIVLGMLYALLGLAPGHSRGSEGNYYGIVWAGLVGAVVALTIVMWRDTPQQPDLASAAEPATSGPQASTKTLLPRSSGTSTRTPVRPSPASHQAVRR